MVVELPAIEQHDVLLSRARGARALREAHRRESILAAELDKYQSTINKALLDARKAADKDDKREEERNLALVRINKELHYTRLAILQRAQDEVRNLQKSSGLTSEDPLDDYALSDADYAALETRITAFRGEYQHLYQLLRQQEGLE
jgi:hypothetical protein